MNKQNNMYIIGRNNTPPGWLLIDPTRVTLVKLNVTPQWHPAITKLVDYNSYGDVTHNEPRVLRLYNLLGDWLMVFLDALGINYPETAPEDMSMTYRLGTMRGDARYYVKSMTQSDNRSPAAYTRAELAQASYVISEHYSETGDVPEEAKDLLYEKVKERGIKNGKYLIDTLLNKYWYTQTSVNTKEVYHLYFFNTEDKDIFLFKKVDGIYVSVPNDERDAILKDNSELNTIINKAIDDDVVWFNLHFYIDSKDELGVFAITPDITDQKCPELISMIKDIPTDALIHTIKQVNPYYSTKETTNERK